MMDYEETETAVNFRSRAGKSMGGLNLTAMIDVVFLLLIFFMVGTNFRLGEEIYRMDLPPEGVSPESYDPFVLEEEPLRIDVNSTGSGRSDLMIRIDGPYDQPSNAEQLRSFLVQHQINDISPAGLFLPDHPIIIRPTLTTRWEHAVDVLNAAARARYTNISFAPPQ